MMILKAHHGTPMYSTPYSGHHLSLPAPAVLYGSSKKCLHFCFFSFCIEELEHIFQRENYTWMNIFENRVLESTL